MVPKLPPHAPAPAVGPLMKRPAVEEPDPSLKADDGATPSLKMRPAAASVQPLKVPRVPLKLRPAAAMHADTEFNASQDSSDESQRTMKKPAGVNEFIESMKKPAGVNQFYEHQTGSDSGSDDESQRTMKKPANANSNVKAKGTGKSKANRSRPNGETKRGKTSKNPQGF